MSWETPVFCLIPDLTDYHSPTLYAQILIYFLDFDEQNSFSSRSSKSDSANQRNQGRVIFGLDQQKTTRQKVSDWFDKN